MIKYYSKIDDQLMRERGAGRDIFSAYDFSLGALYFCSLYSFDVFQLHIKVYNFNKHSLYL